VFGLANLRLGWKGLPGKNESSLITEVKSFMTLTPENETSHPNVNDVLHQNIDLRKNLSKF
jgi:hypothetical protein